MLSQIDASRSGERSPIKELKRGDSVRSQNDEVDTGDDAESTHGLFLFSFFFFPFPSSPLTLFSLVNQVIQPASSQVVEAAACLLRATTPPAPLIATLTSPRAPLVSLPRPRAILKKDTRRGVRKSRMAERAIGCRWMTPGSWQSLLKPAKVGFLPRPLLLRLGFVYPPILNPPPPPPLYGKRGPSTDQSSLKCCWFFF